MNTKDLITNPEFAEVIAESLEDFSQDSLAKYELWIIGYNLDNEPVSELFVYAFDDPEEAIAKAGTTALYGGISTEGAIKLSATKPTAGPVLKVAKATTMPDGQYAVEFHVQ